MTLSLGLVGCGWMARRHILGLRKLRDVNRSSFDLAAVCDIVPANSERAADLAADLLGRRPDVVPTLDALCGATPRLDAVLITTSPDAHTAAGVSALEAGLHVMVEKPLALTVRQGIELVGAARRAGRRLAVAENYRRDPVNRLAKALLEAGAIGRPFLAVQSSSGSGERVIITPWRHRKAGGGIVVDMGIHYADLLEYYLGPIESVAGMNAVVDRTRRDQTGEPHVADAEDLSVGVARFRSGALANWMLNFAGRGESHFMRVIYGERGSLSIPPDRSGRPLKLVQRRHGEDVEIAADDLPGLAPDWRLDDTTAALFGGDRRATYTLEWADVDANLLAIEQSDFAEAIRAGREPEVSGVDGLRSLAIAYGFLDAERLGRSVMIDDLLRGEPAPYQQEIEVLCTKAHP